MGRIPAFPSRMRAGALAASVVAACVLPGEPSGVERITFSIGPASPYRVPLAGLVEPPISISANGQALDNPSYRLETLDTGVVRVDPTERRLLGVTRGTAAVRVTYLGATGTPDTVFSVQVVISRVAMDSPALAFTRLGARARLSAKALDANDAAVPNVPFTWSSADPTVAVVNDTGLVTAVNEGATTIAAAADGVEDSSDVTVTQVAAAVRVAPELDTLRTVGRSIQLIAVAFDSIGNVLFTARPRWTSSDSTVARVDSTGRATAMGAGTALIVARVGAAADSATLVVDQVVRLLVVTPGFDTLKAIADTARIVALALDSLNFPVPTPAVTWATSDATIATVDTTGIVTAVANGVVLVTASSGSQSAFATVVVRQEVAAARVSPESVALTRAGDTVRLSAIAVDRNGFAVGGAAFTWRSSYGFVATVDTAGLVTARVDGTAGIVATSRMGGRSDTATVSVTGAPRPTELIAFWTGDVWNDGTRHIEVMGVDGSGRSVAVVDAAHPTWSRDGARLAYSTPLGIAYVEFGSQQTRIVTTAGREGSSDWRPAWSPDGTKIAFERFGYLLGNDNGGYRIWVVNADGSNARQLRAAGDSACVWPYCPYERHPTWSPDGTKLAFLIAQNGEPFILVMNADGSGPIDTLSGGWPAWSPDGSQLAFSDSGSIVLMNPDGSGRSVLTRGVGWADSPAWSPDGTQIVFVSDVVPWPHPDLYVINRDGTGLQRLTFTDEAERDPAWGQILPPLSAAGTAAIPTRLRSKP